MTIPEYNELEEVVGKVCDKYCKHPTEEGTQEQLNKICEDCPLSIYVNDKYQESKRNKND